MDACAQQPAETSVEMTIGKQIINKLTKICRVVVLWTVQAYRLQIWYGISTRTLIDTVPFGHDVNVIKHFIRAGTRLVYRANHRPATFGEALQDRNTLMRTRAVQTAGKFNSGFLIFFLF